MNSVILGASRGLGKEITDLCQKRGDYTVEISSTVMDFRSDSRDIYKCNLGNIAMVLNCIEYLRKFEVDNFFWVAGQFIKGEFRDHGQKEVFNVIDINFRNPMLIVQEVWRKMQSASAGSVKKLIVISSISGIKSSAGEALYDATKHAQVGFVRALGVENKNPNIQISLFLPGSMRTGMWEKYPRLDFDSLLDPAKVALKIIETVENQKEPFAEIVIPRGSL